MAPGFEDRLRRELEKAAGEPSGSQDVYEQVMSKKARRRFVRRAQSAALVVAVVAGTAGGAFGLAKAFNLGGGERRHQVATGPAATNGRIAFVSNRDGNNEIYSMEPDGSDLRNLTNNPASDTEPAWSPDGTRIAFISDRDGPSDIYLMDADGSDVRRITTVAEVDRTSRLAWSPGGDAIAFAGAASGPCPTINCGWATSGPLWAQRLRSEEHLLLATGPGSDRDPVWGPGGTTILFVRSMEPDGPTSLVQKDLSTGAESELPLPGHNPVEPSLSPGGDRVAFFSQLKGLIWTMSVPSGAGLTQLDPRPTGTPGNDSDPWWSSDGREIVFASTRDIKDDADTNIEIYVMNADGTDPVRLTNDPAVDYEPSWQSVPGGGAPTPSGPLPGPSSTPAVPVPNTAPCILSLAQGDFDADGKPDTAYSSQPRFDGQCPGLGEPREGPYDLTVLLESGEQLHQKLYSSNPLLGQCSSLGCANLYVADLNADGRDEIAVDVWGGASEETYQIHGIVSGRLTAFPVAPPGSDRYPAGSPAEFQLWGGVSHQNFLTCALSRDGTHLFIATGATNFDPPYKAWLMTITILAFDGTTFMIQSSKVFNAPNETGSPPPPRGTACDGIPTG